MMTTKSLSLEVGKSYLTRTGTKIIITGVLAEDTNAYQLGYRFVGGPCGQYYTQDGLTYPGETGNIGDLIPGTDNPLLQRVLLDVQVGHFATSPRSDKIEELDDGTALLLLGSVSNEIFTLASLAEGSHDTIKIKDAVFALKIAFEHAKLLPVPKSVD